MIHSTVFVTLYQLGAESGDICRQFRLGVEWDPSCWQDWLVWSLVEMCDGCLPPALVAGLERLYVDADYVWHGYTMEGNENSPDLWLNVLLLFKSVVNLYVSASVAPYVARVLRGLAKGAWLKMWPYVSVEELLPALGMIRFETPRKKPSIKRFLAVRQDSGHPVTVHHRSRRRNQ
ncbi:hypothetical protein EDB86DRAFT_2828155 [Lactarius hatsudake]|nr:hypothetical protein EDB86DRAFT_2828155 [Lactarius hatsudake]